MSLTFYYKPFFRNDHDFFYDFPDMQKIEKQEARLPVLFHNVWRDDRIRSFVLEKPMFLIQMISGDFQRFTKPLEMYHFSFAQEAQWCQNVRIFCQVDEVFIGAAGFLLCCTFGSVRCLGREEEPRWHVLIDYWCKILYRHCEAKN